MRGKVRRLLLSLDLVSDELFYTQFLKVRSKLKVSFSVKLNGIFKKLLKKQMVTFGQYWDETLKLPFSYS